MQVSSDNYFLLCKMLEEIHCTVFICVVVSIGLLCTFFNAKRFECFVLQQCCCILSIVYLFVYRVTVVLFPYHDRCLHRPTPFHILFFLVQLYGNAPLFSLLYNAAPQVYSRSPPQETLQASIHVAWNYWRLKFCANIDVVVPLKWGTSRLRYLPVPIIMCDEQIASQITVI